MDDDLKRCSKCENIQLKGNFHEKSRSKYGITPHCKRKILRKKYYDEDYDLEINRRRKYRVDTKEKINDYNKKTRESDLNFKLVCCLRSRTSSAFKSKNIKKTNKTFDLLGCSLSFFRRWIIHQLYGNMTIENYGSIWQINHCLPIASFNLLNENDMKKCFDWVNLRLMFFTENNSKKAKIDLYLYLCQEVKAK